MKSTFAELPNNLIIDIIRIDNDRKIEELLMKRKYNEVIQELNKLSDRQKFWATAIGGGVGTSAVIYKAEDVGSLGDLVFNEGEYLAMNRERGKDAKSDAIRQLYNKLKLGTE